MRAEAHGLRRIARNGENFATRLHGKPRRDQRTRILRALDHDNSPRHPGNHAIANREILRSRKRAHGKLTDNRTSFLHFRKYFTILFRIDNVYPAAENADRGAARRAERAFVGAGIYSTRQAADDDKAMVGQIAPKPLSHLIPVGRRTSRANDGDGVAIEKFRVSFDI